MSAEHDERRRFVCNHQHRFLTLIATHQVNVLFVRLHKLHRSIFEWIVGKPKTCAESLVVLFVVGVIFRRNAFFCQRISIVVFVVLGVFVAVFVYYYVSRHVFVFVIVVVVVFTCPSSSCRVSCTFLIFGRFNNLDFDASIFQQHDSVAALFLAAVLHAVVVVAGRDAKISVVDVAICDFFVLCSGVFCYEIAH